jgi:hypothetical protein
MFEAFGLDTENQFLTKEAKEGLCKCWDESLSKVLKSRGVQGSNENGQGAPNNHKITDGEAPACA